MGRWTLDDIPWSHFEPEAVDPRMVRLAKAAALVERNGADYARYLGGVFADDPQVQTAAQSWAEEEIQHGEALGRWAALADPNFDFVATWRRFTEGYRIPVHAARSVRGSRAGELVARCVVEVGTSAHYTALVRHCREPVLAFICSRIAADEFRHYKMFHGHLTRYQAMAALGRWRRLAVALGRVFEASDDELSFAWHCANEGDGAYDRRRCHRAYSRHAFAFYEPEVVARGTAMAAKATGFNPHGAGTRVAAWLAWQMIQRRRD